MVAIRTAFSRLFPTPQLRSCVKRAACPVDTSSTLQAHGLTRLTGLRVGDGRPGRRSECLRGSGRRCTASAAPCPRATRGPPLAGKPGFGNTVDRPVGCRPRPAGVLGHQESLPGIQGHAVPLGQAAGVPAGGTLEKGGAGHGFVAPGPPTSGVRRTARKTAQLHQFPRDAYGLRRIVTSLVQRHTDGYLSSTGGGDRTEPARDQRATNNKRALHPALSGKPVSRRQFTAGKDMYSGDQSTGQGLSAP